MTNPTPCPKCSRPIPDADKFCGGCGTEMPEAPAEMLHVPQEVHERGWQWRPVGDGAFAPPFGTIRACRVCGCLVAGGPTMCMRCTKADGLLAAPPAQPEPAKADERRYPCANCGKLRTKAEGGEVFTTCEGPGHHCDGTPEDAAEPAAPVASGEAEAGTIALDAWLDSRDVMQSTRSEVRHCYRSDLARATKGLRERTEKAERDRDQYREDLERTRADLAALRASQPSGLPGVGESFLANEAGAFTRRTVLCHSMYDTQFSDGNGCWYRLADEGKTWRRLPTGEKGKG
jgi:hypothetical protein